MTQTPWSRVVGALALLLLFPSCAFSAPPEVVTFTIGLSPESEVILTVPAGSVATYEYMPFEIKLGIVPVVVNTENGDIDFRVVAVEGTDAAPEIGAHLETIRGKLGYKAITAVGSRSPVEITPVQISSQSLDGRCGVICGPVAANGFQVVGSCGSCTGN